MGNLVSKNKAPDSKSRIYCGGLVVCDHFLHDIGATHSNIRLGEALSSTGQQDSFKSASVS